MNPVEQKVLKQCARYIAHMRSELHDRRLGLVLGAGVSKELGFPSWARLVEMIAEHPDVDGRHVVANAKVPDTSKTQMLFQHFRAKQFDRSGNLSSAKEERKIHGQWRRIIHQCLYKEVQDDAGGPGRAHPYIKNLVYIIKNSTMTINYNFDDTVQRILTNENHSKQRFETIWSSSLSYRPNTILLYHPNGFLPRNLLDFPSDNIVFSEDSFADQLIESMAGHHSSLMHHFGKNTCLLVGLSLHDTTLKHLLRQNALLNPGHYHYFINWIPDGETPDSDAEAALKQANFHVHNLITMSLNNSEIAALGNLLSMEEEHLQREAEELGVQLKFFYYLTGAVGSGKTTCLSYLGNLQTYEEWAEPRPAELGEAWSSLDADQVSKLDEWIVQQFNLKNCKLMNAKIGIHLIDRSPIDPLAFTKDEDVAKKARAITEGLSPGASSRKAVSGHIVLLTGDPDDMEARVIGRHKNSNAALIRGMQSKLTEILADHKKSIISTAGLSIPQLVQSVARVIFLEDYNPLDLADLLTELEKDAALTLGEGT